MRLNKNASFRIRSARLKSVELYDEQIWTKAGFNLNPKVSFQLGLVYVPGRGRGAPSLRLHLCRLRRVGAPSPANAAIITRRRPG